MEPKKFEDSKPIKVEGGAYKWVVLLLATWAQASATLINYGVGPLALFWKQSYHLTQMETGTLLSAISIGPLFFMLPAGWLLDRWNERLFIGLASVLLGVSILVVNGAGGFAGLLGVLSVTGIFYSAAQPGGSKVIVEWFSKKNRGLAMGIRQAGIPVGGAIGGLVIPVVSARYGWSYAVDLLSALCISAGLLFLLFYKEPPAVNAASRPASPDLLKQLNAIIKNKKLHPVFFAGMGMISLQIVIIGHFTIFLVKDQALSPARAGLIYSVALFSGMAGRILLAFASDRIFHGDRRKPLLLSILAAFVSVCFLAAGARPFPIWVLLLVSGWLGFFGTGWYSLFIVEVAERASREAVGLTVSFALTLNQAVIILAPPAFGWIVDRAGYPPAWLAVSCLLLLAAGGLLKRPGRVKKDS